MKIYNKIVIDMNIGKIVEENSFEYKGKIARCATGAVVALGAVAGMAASRGSGGGGPRYPGMSAEEIEYQQLRLELARQQKYDKEQMRPFELRSQGLIEDEDGNIRKMTEDEFLSGLSASETADYEIMLSSQERLQQAYAGELPVSPAMEAQIQEQEKQFREALSQRLGPGWQTTTSGQQALSEMQTKAELLREEARRGAITGESGIALARSGHLGNVQAMSGQQASGFYGGTAGLFGEYGALMSPHQRQREQEYGSLMGDYQRKQNQRAGFMQGLGSLAGAGITAYGHYRGAQS